MGRLLRDAVETLGFWVALTVFGAMLLGATALGTLLAPLVPREQRATRARSLVRATFATWLAVARGLGLMRLDLRALDALRDAGPLVLAPNHPGLLDAVLVISRLPNVACIMKAELMANPFLGAGARLAGYIVNDSARAMIRRAVEAIQRGAQVLVFPEGTRTVNAPFDEPKGAFALIAVQSQAPVQVILIEADSRFLGKGWPLWRRPAFPLHYRIRLGPRLEPGHDVGALIGAVKAAFAHELAHAARASAPGSPGLERAPARET